MAELLDHNCADAEPKPAAEVPFDGVELQSRLSLSGVRRLECLGEDLRSPQRKLVQARAALRARGQDLSVAFSPDSSFLVTRAENRTVCVWDPEDPRQARVTLRVDEGSVWLAGCSSDSRLLVTRAVDEALMLWRLGLSDLVAIAGRTAGRQLANKEATDIIGDAQAKPCSDRP